MIKHIIFDLGGVLYLIDHRRTYDKLAMLAANQKNALKRPNLSLLIQDPLFEQFERGLLSSKQFIEKLKKSYDIQASDQDIELAFSAMLIEPRANVIDFLHQIKNQYRMALLSNTNDLHYQIFYPQCRHFFQLFEGCFFSHHLGLRKPDAEIFQVVLDSLEFSPSDTLFVDDTLANIETAQKLGLQTFHFKHNHQLIDIKNFLC